MPKVGLGSPIVDNLRRLYIVVCKKDLKTKKSRQATNIAKSGSWNSEKRIIVVGKYTKPRIK